MLSRAPLALTSLAALTFGFAIACGSNIPPPDDNTSAATTTPASSSSSTSSGGGNSSSKPVETSSSGFPEDGDKEKDGGTTGTTSSSGGGGDGGGGGGGSHIVPAAKDCAAGSVIELEPNDTTAQSVAATGGKTQTFAICGAAKTGDTDVYTFKLPDTASNISTKVKWTVGTSAQVVIKVSAKADGADGDGHVEDGTLQSPPFIRGGTYTVTVTSATASANTYNMSFSTDTL